MKKWKHFGTDGIRGIVGDTFTPDYIYNITRAAMAVCQSKKIVIGWDTRKSCDFIVNIFAGTAAAFGADVIKVGTVPTAALSFLTNKLKADLGVMVSASHNGFAYNGLKFFSSNGEKLDEKVTAETDALISKACKKNAKIVGLIPVPADKAGKIITDTKVIKVWQKFLIRKFGNILHFNPPSSPFRIALDCAFGSGTECAETVLKTLGFDVTLYNAEHNGVNINSGCGATAPAYLQSQIRSQSTETQGFKAGFAFDGDADRCVVFDEKGNAVHGDILLYLLAKHLGAKKLAATVMFNLGVEMELNKSGIKLLRTPVGDRYIYKVIKQNRLTLGGETSGHIIFPKIFCSGDGLLTALAALEMLVKSGKSMSELCRGLNIYPQINKNIAVTNEQKKRIKDYIKTKDGYKIIVRPSGTENVIRVTAEGEDRAECERLANKIIFEIKQQCAAQS